MLLLNLTGGLPKSKAARIFDVTEAKLPDISDTIESSYPHKLSECACGHGGNPRPDHESLDGTHQWLTVPCDPDCDSRTDLHFHKHVHCPQCARTSPDGKCCDPFEHFERRPTLGAASGL